MFTLSLLILGSTLAAPAPADAAKKAQDELQGTWVAIAYEEKGELATPEELAKEVKISVIIKGNELTMPNGKGKPYRFSFTLDPSKRPAQMDLTVLGDEGDVKVVHAIYSIEKGVLKICMGTRFNPDKPENRPQEFATVLGSEQRPPKGKVMCTLKKEKP